MERKTRELQLPDTMRINVLLPLMAIAISSVLLPTTAQAQRSSEKDTYQKRERFPILRKAFRRIRSDVRYHTSALRDTASGISNDVVSSIRGTRSGTERYGYRNPTPRQPHHHEQRPAPRGLERREPPPYNNYAPRRNPAPDQEPRIVAPRELDPHTQRRIDPQLAQPDPQTKPKPEADRGQKSDPKKNPAPKTNKKPVRGKVAYPEAKRSNRPGYHYSPFEPFELLDTRDIEPGGLAKDPGNGKIFRIPK